MRILAVDPGEKRLGVAISDPTGTIATPNTVLQHRSKTADAERIIALAVEACCECIVVGIALDPDGGETESSRRARNLAAEIRKRSDLEVVLWDEAGSTRAARAAAIEIGAPRKKRRGHLDAQAAAVILQSYLDDLKNKLPG
ncbi:MAG TPA: Holliday junction resolvase RuvX [Anaerolineales bacterium]|nr:Holliday junction resolvase RuvX [Anaerolineales bacterium]